MRRRYCSSAASRSPPATGSRANPLPFPMLYGAIDDIKQWMRLRARVPAAASVQTRAARSKFAQQMLPFIGKLPTGCTQHDDPPHRADLASIK